VNARLRRRQTAQWARFVRAAELVREHAEHLARSGEEPQAARPELRATVSDQTSLDALASASSSPVNVVQLDSRRPS